MELRKSFSIREKDKKSVKALTDFLMSYRHVENMVIILINSLYEDFQLKEESKKKEIRRLSSHLLNYIVMKALLSKNKSSSSATGVEELHNHFKENQIFLDLIELCSENLNSHNCAMVIRRLKSQYTTIFKEFRKGNFKVSFPKPKKLERVVNYSLPLEPSKFSFFKRKKTLGITLGKKQLKLYLGECSYLVSKKIKSLNLQFSNNCIYYNFTYQPLAIEPTKEGSIAKSKVKREAGIDIGIKNLISLVINDKERNSLLISGKEAIKKNFDFNSKIAKYSSLINSSSEEEELKVKKLKLTRRYIIEERNRFFDDYTNKLSTQILEYLALQKVSYLTLSKNLSFMKKEGDFKSRVKSEKQKFYQIPFGRIINRLIEKSSNYGIKVLEVNEAWTSKTSCLSEDVNLVQKNKVLQAELSGVRGSKSSSLKRGQFLDKKIKKIFNSDLNGAFNILKLGGAELQFGPESLYKLNNPFKIKKINEFPSFLKKEIVKQRDFGLINHLNPKNAVEKEVKKS